MLHSGIIVFLKSEDGKSLIKEIISSTEDKGRSGVFKNWYYRLNIMVFSVSKPKKSQKGLKEEIVKSLESLVMEGIQNRIENAIDEAKLGKVSSSQNASIVPELEKSFVDRLDITDSVTNDLKLKIEKMVDDVEKLQSTSKTVSDLDQWKNSGLVSLKEDWLLGLWGLSVLQVR